MQIVIPDWLLSAVPKEAGWHRIQYWPIEGRATVNGLEFTAPGIAIESSLRPGWKSPTLKFAIKQPMAQLADVDYLELTQPA